MTVLPTVRDQLLRTAERRASGQSSGRPSRLRGLSAARWLPAGHLLAAALVAVSIVIGAAAIVVIGARRSVPISPAAVGSVRAPPAANPAAWRAAKASDQRRPRS
jgi:hypothetical protein